MSPCPPPHDGKLAAQLQNAFAHSEKAERIFIADFLWSDPSSIVPHLQHESGMPLLDSDSDPCCLRVARDVGQNLLRETEKLDRHVRIEDNVLGGGAELRAHAGSLLELLAQAFQRRNQAELIQHFWSQFSRD